MSPSAGTTAIARYTLREVVDLASRRHDEIGLQQSRIRGGRLQTTRSYLTRRCGSRIRRKASRIGPCPMSKFPAAPRESQRRAHHARRRCDHRRDPKDGRSSGSVEADQAAQERCLTPDPRPWPRCRAGARADSPRRRRVSSRTAACTYRRGISRAPPARARPGLAGVVRVAARVRVVRARAVGVPSTLYHGVGLQLRDLRPFTNRGPGDGRRGQARGPSTRYTSPS